MVVYLCKLKSDFRTVAVTMYQTKKYKQAKKKGKTKMAAGNFAPPTPLGRLAAEKFSAAPLRPHGDPQWRRFVFLPFGRLFGVH